MVVGPRTGKLLMGKTICLVQLLGRRIQKASMVRGLPDNWRGVGGWKCLERYYFSPVREEEERGKAAEKGA